MSLRTCGSFPAVGSFVQAPALAELGVHVETFCSPHSPPLCMEEHLSRTGGVRPSLTGTDGGSGPAFPGRRPDHTGFSGCLATVHSLQVHGEEDKGETVEERTPIHLPWGSLQIHPPPALRLCGWGPLPLSLGREATCKVPVGAQDASVPGGCFRPTVSRAGAGFSSSPKSGSVALCLPNVVPFDRKRSPKHSSRGRKVPQVRSWGL